MKKLVIFYALVLMTIFSSFNTTFRTVESEIVSSMRSRGYTLSDNRYVHLKEGQYSQWWSRTYYSDYEYSIVAFSEDDDVLDIDLVVESLNGDYKKKDEDEDDLAVVNFSPAFDRTLYTRMTNYSSLSFNASRCKYLVFLRLR